MNFTQSFHDFVNTGKRPDSDRERSALLDEARAVISDICRRVESGEIRLAGPNNFAQPSQADLDRMQRQSLADKAARERQLQATREAYEKQRQQREAIEKRAASKPAQAVSMTPHLDALAKLKGADASAYYKTNVKAIAAEQGRLRREADDRRHGRTK
jgi:hypothetical protein